MSADNWAICPRCKADADTKQQQLAEKIATSYGKIPEAEYLELRIQAESKPVLSETLREDYELCTNADGTFEVSYSCSCSRCGFRYSYGYSADTNQKNSL